MRVILRLMIFLCLLVFVTWGLLRIVRENTSGQLPIDIKQALFTFVVPTPKTETPSVVSWTEGMLLEKINDYRDKKKLKRITLNENNIQAAKMRLAVIGEYDDYEGTASGLTREAAMKAVGAEYSWIGDLTLVDFFSINDPVAFWLTNKNAQETLENTYLNQAGIALKQNDGRVTAYVILTAPAKKLSTKEVLPKAAWGGPDLWEAINKRRLEMGVNPLRKSDELCTVAAIRLNQLLAAGKLDGHEGFGTTLAREDLKYLSTKYDISEFLVSGYRTPEETVKAWEDTMGHRKLLSGGEYIWGCVYAQNTIGVAITAF